MNRDDKRRFKRVVKTYDRSVRLVQSVFEKEVGEMKEKESEKLENLPQSFESSALAEQLDESAGMLESLLDKAEEVTDALDEILSLADMKSDFTAITQETTITHGKKDARFLALFPSSLLKRLKEESARTGLSMNEIVCRAVTKALSD
jgi:predicted DNA binding CopG/RHH family protein